MAHPGNPAPAAWEAEIIYPKEIIRIRGASLLNHAASNSWELGETGPHTGATAMVLLESDDDPEAVVGCGAGSGTLKLRVVNPALQPASVRVAFDLRNFGTPTYPTGCSKRAVAGDFTIASFKAFDEDGVDITESVNYSIPASLFR